MGHVTWDYMGPYRMLDRLHYRSNLDCNNKDYKQMLGDSYSHDYNYDDGDGGDDGYDVISGGDDDDDAYDYYCCYCCCRCCYDDEYGMTD